MIGSLYYVLILALAVPLRHQMSLLEDWRGWTRFGAALTLAQFGATWIAFLCYVIFGMNSLALTSAFLLLAALNAYSWRKEFQSERYSHGVGVAWGEAWVEFIEQIPTLLKRRWPLLLFVLLIAFPFVTGVWVDASGAVRFRFNFIDTAFHLSVSRSFLSSPRFPPADLNAVGYPLNYHFLGDFLPAFLTLGGLNLIRTMITLNAIQGVLGALVLWGVLERFLKNPPPLVTLSIGSMILVMMTWSANLAHSFVFQPSLWEGRTLFDILSYPFMNFEFILLNLFEPQRGLMFSFPVILLLMSGMYMLWDRYSFKLWREVAWGLCLMPFSQVITLPVLGAYFLPHLRFLRKMPLRQLLLLLIPLGLAGAQFLYSLGLTPRLIPGFNGWDAIHHIPLGEFESRWPEPLAFMAFWLSANGEFFILGGIGILLAWNSRRNTRRNSDRLISPTSYFLAVSFAFFILIHFLRLSPNWGNSNKIVWFLNFWLSVMLGQQMALRLQRGRFLGWILVSVILLLSLVPYIVDTRVRLQRQNEILFSRAEILATEWIEHHSEPTDLFLTAAESMTHFVPALAPRIVVQGIYSNMQPYRDDHLRDQIRNLYEQGNLDLLRERPVRFVIVSRYERSRYRLHPIFREDQALVYSGEGVGWDGVRIYDASQLLKKPLSEPKG